MREHGLDTRQEELPVANLPVALARLDGSRKLLCEMIAFFREDSPQLLGQIKSGTEGCDSPAVKRAAHSLKGLAAMFDGAQTVALARQIEAVATDDQLDDARRIMPQLQEAVARLNHVLENYLNIGPPS